MGIYDREYYQDDTSQQGLFGAIRNWPWSYRLIGFYVVLFFLDHLIPASTSMGGIGSPGIFTEWGAFNPVIAFQYGQIWRLLTFQFIESDPQSLLFGMLMLFFTGPVIENMLGRTKFLVYYFLCGIGTALIGSVFYLVLHGGWPSVLVGPWGSITGLVIAAGVLVPQQQVIFMFVIPTTQKWVAVIWCGILAALAVSSWPIAICQLGGALTGYVLLKSRVGLSWVDRLPLPTGGGRGRRGSFPATVPFSKIGAAFSPKPVSEEELDRLLDKVHAHGIESLTTREKSTLKRASKQRRNRPNTF